MHPQNAVTPVRWIKYRRRKRDQSQFAENPWLGAEAAASMANDDRTVVCHFCSVIAFGADYGESAKRGPGFFGIGGGVSWGLRGGGLLAFPADKIFQGDAQLVGDE